MRHLLVTNDFPPKVGGIQNYLWDLWQPPRPGVLRRADRDLRRRRRRVRRRAGRAWRAHRARARLDPLLPDARRTARRRRLRARPRIDLVLLDPVLPLGLLGPRLGVPYGVVLHGAEVTVPGRLPGTRAAPGACPAGRVARRLGRALPGGRGAPRRPRPHGPRRRDPARRRHRAPSRPLDAAERRAARARLGLPAPGRSSSASAGWCLAREWTC